jgi:hypothetical protein
MIPLQKGFSSLITSWIPKVLGGTLQNCVFVGVKKVELNAIWEPDCILE